MGLINEVSHLDAKILTDVCELLNRRNFLSSLGKWSPAVLDSLEMCSGSVFGELDEGAGGQPSLLHPDNSYAINDEWADAEITGLLVKGRGR